MTIKQAIESAVKGGYDPSWNITKTEQFPELYNRAFLDPDFWHALGKSEGWGNVMFPLEYHIDGRTEFLYWTGQNGHRYTPHIEGWQYHWHNLIDHLVAGGTIEDFFTRLDTTP